MSVAAASADPAPSPSSVALDLERLQQLLADACDTLLACFDGSAAELRREQPDVHAALRRLDDAVIALQFQDMAQQLIAHAQARLAHGLARANPVTQGGVTAGSVELF
jgi:ubiquinone biosynthesis protein UbiJ